MLSHLFIADDIKKFLDKLPNIIINGLSVIDRTFLYMETVKAIFCTMSLLDIHIAYPDSSQNSIQYFIVVVTCLILYEELKEVKDESRFFTRTLCANMTVT